MELGDLELAVLRALRTLGEASSGAIHKEVRRTRDVAYTSVTTTLYRLVDKNLVAVRRESERRIFYRVKEGRAYERALSSIVGRLVDAFGAAAVSRLLGGRSKMTEAHWKELEARVAERRRRE